MPRFVWAVFLSSLAVGCGTAEDPKGDDSKGTKTQEEAIQEAKDVDLKLLEKADRVVIVPGGPKPGASVTVKGDDVAELRKALVPRTVSPSGGITAATLKFYEGETLLRSVWVFSYGEWGFERPGRISWSIGKSDGLWDLVSKHLK